MQKRTQTLFAVAAVAAIAAGGIAVASTGDDSEQPITGDAYAKAAAAALAHTGGGRVTDTEQGDEDSYYEVEVTMPDGREIDVQLDDSFRVVGAETEPGDDGGEGDDD